MKDRSVTVKHLAEAFGFVLLLGGAIVGFEARYQSADAFERFERYSTGYHLEQEIQRAQDKLEGLLIIPAKERKEWQIKEILRLQAIIERKKREIEKL